MGPILLPNTIWHISPSNKTPIRATLLNSLQEVSDNDNCEAQYMDNTPLSEGDCAYCEKITDSYILNYVFFFFFLQMGLSVQQ